MKHSTGTRHFIRAAVFGLLALTLPTACRKANLDDKPTAAAASSQLAKDMIGTWVHVGRPGQVRAAPAAGGRLKFRTGAHWTLTHADRNTGLVTEHFGGTYTLNSNDRLVPAAMRAFQGGGFREWARCAVGSRAAARPERGCPQPQRSRASKNAR